MKIPSIKQNNEIIEMVVDAYGCTTDPNDAAGLEKYARLALESVGLKVTQAAVAQLPAQGVTLCLAMPKSHLTITTVPANDLTIVSLFFANAAHDPQKVWEKLQLALKPSSCITHTVTHALLKKKV